MKQTKILSVASVAAMCALFVGGFYVGCSSDDAEEDYDELLTTRANETMPQVAENNTWSDVQSTPLNNKKVIITVFDEANNVSIPLECYFSGYKNVTIDHLENGGSITTVTVTRASLSVINSSGASGGAQYSEASAELGSTSSIRADESSCTFNFHASANYNKVITYSDGQKRSVSSTAVKDGTLDIYFNE